MPNQKQWLVETKDLTRIYKDGAEIRALDNVNIHVSPGELIAVMGPSGSGKSTLLNMIGALDIPTSGKVLIEGQDLQEIKDKDTFRAKKVGFIFQLHNLLPTMTTQENVEVPMIGHENPKERKERSEHLLELVGLADRMKHLPNQLSGGQQQRVSAARALANNPPLVLADEPTGNLDTQAGQDFIDLLQNLNESQGTTFLVVTHDPKVARQLNRVLVMADGKIVRRDTVGSPIEEDLKMWQHSGLGRRILEGDLDSLKELEISKQQLKALHNLLKNEKE